VQHRLAQGAHFDRERMAGHLRQTVLHLVTKMIGETGVAPDVLAGRIEAATDMLADSAESAILRLHPDDVASVQSYLPKTVFPVGDSSVARGGFVIESASTIVEDGPDMWLEQLAQAIDRVPIPPSI
jgi:flagellar assembly protein FliH